MVRLMQEDVKMVAKAISPTADGVKTSTLYDYDWFSDTQGNLILVKKIHGVCLMDPLGPDIPQVFSGDKLKVETQPYIELLDSGTLTWSGTAGYQYGSSFTAKGFREILCMVKQPTWTSAPSGTYRKSFGS